MTRRDMLQQCMSGFGMVAAAGMMGPQAMAALLDGSASPRTLRPRARNVIFLYMDGGPSSMDTFDPKPRLAKENGQPFGMAMEPTQFNNNGNTLGSPWAFRPGGSCGTPWRGTLRRR